MDVGEGRLAQANDRTAEGGRSKGIDGDGTTASVSITEGEAQKSKPTDANSSATLGVTGTVKNETPTNTLSNMPASSSSSSSTSLDKQKPKRSTLLRPRRAAITLSSTAVTQLRALLDQPEPKFIRVGVRNRGCSGLAYHLEYVDKAGTFDEAVEQDGVKVLVDSKALFSIIGSEMDWIEDKLSRRFVFRNPNISEWSLLLFNTRYTKCVATSGMCCC